MQDALRTYLELATGLTDASRKTVTKVVKDVADRTGATAEQARALTAELMSSNAANREALTKLVRFEVDRALGVVGLATADEVKQLTRRVRDLERQLRDAEAQLASRPTTKSTSAKSTTAKRAAKKASGRTSPAKTSAKKTSSAKKASPAKKTSRAKKTSPAAKASPARKAATASTGRRAGQESA